MSTGSDTIPRIGLGTFGLTDAEGVAAMRSAIDLGYRHLDTAQTYGTEENVGRAIASSGLGRRDFFVTTKVTASNLGRLAESVDDSLKLMGFDYADLVLIHWPAPYDDPPVTAYAGKLARLQDGGKARLIGVSFMKPMPPKYCRQLSITTRPSRPTFSFAIEASMVTSWPARYPSQAR